MGYQPQYAGNPRSRTVRINTANTGRDGSGTITDLMAAAGAAPPQPGGSRIERLRMRYVGANGVAPSAGMLRFWKKDTAGGGVQSPALLFEVPVSAIAPAAGGTPGWLADLSSDVNPDLMPIWLQPGQTLAVSTEVGETFDVTAEGGDFL